LPGDDFSKIKPSFWLMWRVALRVMCFVIAHHLVLCRLLHARTDRSLSATSPTAVSIIDACRQLRAAPKRRVAKLGIKLFQRQAADDFVSQQPRVDGIRIFARLDHELVEARRTRKQHFGMFAELVGRIRSFCQILLRQFPQADLAVHRHENIHHERDQRLVGTDIRSRFLAPDVLLSRSQRQNEPALAILVDGLAARRPGICRTNFSFVASTPQ
jgi:hypothetical protein